MAQGNLSQELLLGIVKLTGAQGFGAHRGQLFADQPFHPFVETNIRAEVHVEHPCILIHHVVGFNVVGHSVPFADVEVESTIHRRTTEQVGHHGHGQLVFGIATWRHASADVVDLVHTLWLNQVKRFLGLRSLSLNALFRGLGR